MRFMLWGGITWLMDESLETWTLHFRWSWWQQRVCNYCELWLLSTPILCTAAQLASDVASEVLSPTVIRNHTFKCASEVNGFYFERTRVDSLDKFSSDTDFRSSRTSSWVENIFMKDKTKHIVSQWYAAQQVAFHVRFRLFFETVYATTIQQRVKTTVGIATDVSNFVNQCGGHERWLTVDIH